MKLRSGKVALVTGGAQGIGHAIATGLAAEGARIVVADLAAAPRRRRRASRTASGSRSTCRTRTSRAWPRRRSSAAAASTSSSTTPASTPRCAMRPFDQIPLEEWRRVMDVNVASMFLTCRAVVPMMREQGGGKIVNISVGDAVPRRPVPAPLRHQRGRDRRLHPRARRELGKDGVLVNCVAPGFTMSDGVQEHAEVVGSSATSRSPRGRSSATRCRRTSSAPSSSSAGPSRLRHRPDDRHRRRPVLPLMRLSRYVEPGGVETDAGNRWCTTWSGTPPLRRRPDRRPSAALRAGGGAGPGALLSAEVEFDRGEAWLLLATASTSRPAGSRTGTRTRGPGSAVSSRG